MKPNPLSHDKSEWWWEPIARRYLDQPFSTAEAVELLGYSRSYTAERLRRWPRAITRVDGSSPAMWRFTHDALEVAVYRRGANSVR
jgi:hypothetical protein